MKRWLASFLVFVVFQVAPVSMVRAAESVGHKSLTPVIAPSLSAGPIEPRPSNILVNKGGHSGYVKCEVDVEEVNTVAFVDARSYATCLDASYTSVDGEYRRFKFELINPRVRSFEFHEVEMSIDQPVATIISNGWTKVKTRFDLKTTLGAAPYRRASSPTSNMVPFRFLNDALGIRTMWTDDAVYVDLTDAPKAPLWDKKRVGTNHLERLGADGTLADRSSSWDLLPSTVFEFLEFAPVARKLETMAIETSSPYEIHWSSLSFLFKDSHDRVRVQYKLPWHHYYWNSKCVFEECSHQAGNPPPWLNREDWIEHLSMTTWLHHRQEVRKTFEEAQQRVEELERERSRLTNRGLILGSILVIAEAEEAVLAALLDIVQAWVQSIEPKDVAPALIATCYWDAEDEAERTGTALSFGLRLESDEYSCVPNLEVDIGAVLNSSIPLGLKEYHYFLSQPGECGTWCYKDEGFDLTDGTIPLNEWRDTSWVAWKTGRPMITADLGQAYEIQGVRLWMLNDRSGGICFPAEINVQGSSDTVNWTSVGSLQTACEDWVESRWIHVPATGQYRYLRIVIDRSNTTFAWTDTWVFLGELEPVVVRPQREFGTQNSPLE